VTLVELLLLVVPWVGHACVWTYLLNVAYSQNISKRFLKPFRLFVGLVIAVGLPLHLVAFDFSVVKGLVPVDVWFVLNTTYLLVCLFLGCLVFPLITAYRHLRPPPDRLLSTTTRTLDLWPELGDKLVGDGRMPWAVRLPFTTAFKVDFTDVTLAMPHLPPAWDGLTIDLVSDLHFHGTPSEAYFHRVIDEMNARPPADVVALAGDYLDSHTHHDWIPRVLGKLKWNECGVAILGNHDCPYDPWKTRELLAGLGYHVVSDTWKMVTIRGQECVLIGHEGPWFRKTPDLTGAPKEPFRLCVSHTPDHFYWGAKHGVDLMLCGHVHGGQIRVPVVGSIFVPSRYSRRFDQGVFEEGRTLMVVTRGLSGKEPIRFRCHPQVVRITLRAGA
jgi:predicted MPP superfamily phosphohydrolase